MIECELDVAGTCVKCGSTPAQRTLDSHSCDVARYRGTAIEINRLIRTQTRLQEQVADLERHVRDGESFDQLRTRCRDLEKQVAEHLRWSEHPWELRAALLQELLGEWLGRPATQAHSPACGSQYRTCAPWCLKERTEKAIREELGE